eukprot:1506526-Amphidinium_carterae.1
MAHSTTMPPTSEVAEPTTWEEAIRVGSRNVRMTERLLSRCWLLPFPLPIEDAQDAGAEQEQAMEFTEMTILGLYWGVAPPDQPPHSVLFALPEIAAAGIENATSASVSCVDPEGTAVGETTCSMVVASAEYVSKHICESCPQGSTHIAFMEEFPGCLPVTAQLLGDEHIPRSAENGTWLFLDDQGAVRLRTHGALSEEVYQSAAEMDNPDEYGLVQVQPWLGEAASLAPCEKPCCRPLPPYPKEGSASGQSKDVPWWCSGSCLAADPHRRHRHEQPCSRQQQQQQQQQLTAAPPIACPPPSKALQSKCHAAPSPPPPMANPWCARTPVSTGNSSGFLPCGYGGSTSILAPGSAQGSYQQAVLEAQRLLGTGQPLPPPPAAHGGRHIPSGLPGVSGGAGPRTTERKVDSDLRNAVMKGGDDSQIAINLAIVDALGRIGSGASAARPAHEIDPLDQFFEHDASFDSESSKGSGAAGVRNLARLAAAIQRDPDRWVQQCNHAAARALGADVQGVHWTMEEYGARQLRFKGNEALERTWALLAHLHVLESHGTRYSMQWTLASRLELDFLARNQKPRGKLCGTRAGASSGVSCERAVAARLQHDRDGTEERRHHRHPTPAPATPAPAERTTNPKDWREAARKECAQEGAVLRGKQPELIALCSKLEQLVSAHSVPRNRSRLRELQAEPTRSMLMGAYTAQGQGVTRATRLPWVKDALGLIHQMAALRSLGGQPGGYTSVAAQTNPQLHAHRDRNNYGCTWLLACGDYADGQLWVEAVGSELTDGRTDLVYCLA